MEQNEILPIPTILYNFYIKHGWTHEKIMSLAPVEYTEYAGNGEYLKTWYDIIYQGEEYLNVYPNAGQFWITSDFKIQVSDVYKWRLSKTKRF